MRRFLGLRWLTIALIMLGALVNFLSRQTLSIAAPTVIANLHITTQQYGWITSAFQGGIMLQPVVGYVIDILGVKSGFALFAFLWSVICMAHGLAGSWQVLAGLRGLLGFAEGAFSPGGLKVVSEWFPAKERGLAGGLYNIGPSLGSMMAPPLVAWAILNYSWQASFVIVGLISLVWVALWLVFYRPVREHPVAVGRRARATSFPARKASCRRRTRSRPILSILKRRNFWGIALPRFLTDPTWGMLSFWVPLYLTTVRHFDLKHIALYAWLPFLAADLGCIFGPGVVLFLQKRGLDLIDARRGAFTLGALMMIGVAFTGVVQGSADGGGADQPGRLRPPDPVGHHDHHGHRPVSPQRSRHRGRHGRHLRQSGHPDLHPCAGAKGRPDRLYSGLRSAGGAGYSSPPSSPGP